MLLAMNTAKNKFYAFLLKLSYHLVINFHNVPRLVAVSRCNKSAQVPYFTLMDLVVTAEILSNRSAKSRSSPRPDQTVPS